MFKDGHLMVNKEEEKECNYYSDSQTKYFVFYFTVCIFWMAVFSTALEVHVELAVHNILECLIHFLFYTCQEITVRHQYTPNLLVHFSFTKLMF